MININDLYHFSLGYKLFTNFQSQRNWKQWINPIITFISVLYLPISVFKNLSWSVSMAGDTALENIRFFGPERVGSVQNDPLSGVLGVLLLLSVLRNKEVNFCEIYGKTSTTYGDISFPLILCQAMPKGYIHHEALRNVFGSSSGKRLGETWKYTKGQSSNICATLLLTWR